MFSWNSHLTKNIAPGTGSNNDFSPAQWTNLNAFIARLTCLSSSTKAFDFSLYAIWAFRAALEETGEAEPAEVNASKAWFVYAKETLEKLSQEKREFEGKIARPGDKYKDKNWRGFNAERFEIWQTGLQ